MNDISRIEFIRDTRGVWAAIEFAKQCVAVYRKACLTGKRKCGKGYFCRAGYVKSYLFHKKIINHPAR